MGHGAGYEDGGVTATRSGACETPEIWDDIAALLH